MTYSTSELKTESQCRVRSTDQGKESISREGHGICLLYNWGELQHLGVHVKRGDSSRGNDHTAKTLKDRLNGKGGI